jgi:hypothetical protein
LSFSWTLFLAACAPPADSPADSAAPAPGWSEVVAARLDAGRARFRPDGRGLVADQVLMGLKVRVADGATELRTDTDVLHLALRGWGREGRQVQAASVDPVLGACVPTLEDVEGACLPRAEHAPAVGLTEWWISEPGGVEVGWELEIGRAHV